MIKTTGANYTSENKVAAYNKISNDKYSLTRTLINSKI